MCLQAGLGEDYGLRRLAERHGHDPATLDQVFWHILTRLSYYRELHVRSQQLAEARARARVCACVCVCLTCLPYYQELHVRSYQLGRCGFDCVWWWW